MEKVFKKLCLYFSYMLILITAFSVFAIPIYVQTEREVDFYSAAEIAQNIKNMELNMTSVIYVRNAKGKWVEYQRLHGDENRIWVDIEKMPKQLQDAFVAIEDERFNEHSGVDWKRTIGAAGNFFVNYTDVEYGGSTITQQLIKNVTMDNDKSALRKFREIVRAMLVEKQLSKTEILEAYLNTISLGNGICGVQVAANYYFNKDVSKLTLNECAAIAAITKNPTKFNPIAGMEENDKRRNTVLDKMLELKMITKKEYDAAYDKPIKLDNSKKDDLESEVNNYFVDALIDQLIADLAAKYNCSEDIASTMLYNGGYRIYSTVNPNIQSTMEKTYLDTKKYFNLTGENAKGEPVGVQSAMTITDYKGHIVGIVGGVGKKTESRGLNRATSAPRQPGSTMKPLGVYALAIEKNIVNYTSRVLDQPIDNYYPDGKSGPKEWYGYYKGKISVNYAIRKSANTIPVRLLKEIGINNSYNFLTQKLNLKYLNEQDKNLSSLALGGCVYGLTTTESAAAYAIFGNNGLYFKPTTYYSVSNYKGEVILSSDTKGTQVISPATASIMNHLLQEVVYKSEGTGSGIASYNYSMKAYAKTGTSSESNDLWMVAGTPYYVGSVWYGFDKPQQINSTSAAAKVWRDVMYEVHKNLPKREFVDSKDIYKKGSGYYKNGTKPDYSYELTGSSDDDSSDTTSSSPTTSAPTTSQTPSTPGGTSSNQSTPSVPTDPNLPPDSSDPTSPSEPTQPSDPTVPGEPTNPDVPSEPTTPSEPADATSHSQ